MTGKTHKVGGAVAGVLVIHMMSNSYNLEMAACTIGGAVLGSLLPDIDHPRSTISIRLWYISWPLLILKKIIKIITSGLSKKEQRDINTILGHRGITHSLIALISVLISLVALGILTKQITKGYYMAFVIGVIVGMLSHLLLDMLSNGITLFCPFNYKRIGVKWVKTGSIREWIVLIILCLILSFMLLMEFTDYKGLRSC